MRACVQRVSRASVRVGDELVGEIGSGLLVLLGVAGSDGVEQVKFLADKITQLRIFEDEQGKMNRSLLDQGGAMLVVSQFTLFGECRRGRRPSFTGAAEPVLAEKLYLEFVEAVRRAGVVVAQGRFRATMHVELVNEGPVTLWLDTQE